MLRLSQQNCPERVRCLGRFLITAVQGWYRKVAWTRQISVIGAELQIIDYFMQVVQILGCDINVHPAILSVIGVVKWLVG